MWPKNSFKNKLKEVDESYVFDKAKFHFDSVEEAGLEESQAYVHTGLFLAWLINNGLISDFFREESGAALERTTLRTDRPSEIYRDWDGVLVGEMLNKEGFNFALSYFDFDNGQYLKHFEKILCAKGNHIIAVDDSWENYDKIKPAIDAAYKKWKGSFRAARLI